MESPAHAAVLSVVTTFKDASGVSRAAGRQA